MPTVVLHKKNHTQKVHDQEHWLIETLQDKIKEKINGIFYVTFIKKNI